MCDETTSTPTVTLELDEFEYEVFQQAADELHLTLSEWFMLAASELYNIHL